tara:strand:+ start:489 stop:1865 length:1377 start_codon:yes stop_codon:yes gene_type:complete
MEKEYKLLFPSNNPSDATYSNATGQVEIVFPISAQDVFLKGGSLRFCGGLELEIYGAAGAVTDIDPATQAKRVYLDWRTGLYSCIQQLSIRSLVTRQSLEVINNYDQLMSSLIPVFHSEADYSSTQSNTHLAGNDVNKSLKMMTGTARRQTFASRLYSGLLFNDEPIPLSRTFGTGGLEITIRLQVPQQVLSDLGGGGATNGSGATFRVINPSLQYEVLKPSPEQLGSLQQQSESVFRYNSLSSLVSVINSGDHNAVFNVASVSGLISAFVKMVPTNWLNSYSNWSQSTGELRNSTTATPNYVNKATLRRVSFYKGGVKYPLDFSIIRNQLNTNEILLSQFMRYGVDSIRNFDDINHILPDGRIKADDNNAYQVIAAGPKVAADIINGKDTYKGSEYFILGTNFDPLGESGAPFDNETFGFEVQSDLTNTNDSPNTAFIFLMSKNTLRTNQGVAQVTM